MFSLHMCHSDSNPLVARQHRCNQVTCLVTIITTLTGKQNHTCTNTMRWRELERVVPNIFRSNKCEVLKRFNVHIYSIGLSIQLFTSIPPLMTTFCPKGPGSNDVICVLFCRVTLPTTYSIFKSIIHTIT